MNILIATPMHAGAAAEFVTTVMRLQAHFSSRGVGVSFAPYSLAEIARSRNVLATFFYENAHFTHLLFVDSDMVFDPAVVQAMLDADRPLVGAICPQRRLNLDRLIGAARRLTDRSLIMAAALDFNISVDDAAFSIDEHGMAKVAGVGMAVALVQRRVFDELLSTGGIKRDPGFRTPWLKGPVLGFFDPVPTEETFISEDISFCRRWRELCGGEVFALATHEIGHAGPMVFRGRFIDALRAEAEAPTSR